jgi:hypothetical protein
VNSWVVVLELAVRDTGAYLDLDELDRLVQAAASEGLEVVYEPDRRAVQLVVHAPTASEALQDGVRRWFEVARHGAASAWLVSRVEVVAASG